MRRKHILQTQKVHLMALRGKYHLKYADIFVFIHLLCDNCPKVYFYYDLLQHVSDLQPVFLKCG